MGNRCSAGSAIFLKEYDLSGKTVIPFCTHDGYGAGNSYQTIAEASHAAVLLEGIAIEAKDVPNAQDTVSSWLADIGISKSEVQTGTPIKITVGEVRLDGILYDTELAEEIKTYFPLTISMVGYGGREYYGGVEFYPEHLEGGQKNLRMVILPIAWHITTWLSSMHRQITRYFLWMSFRLAE